MKKFLIVSNCGQALKYSAKKKIDDETKPICLKKNDFIVFHDEIQEFDGIAITFDKSNYITIVDSNEIPVLKKGGSGIKIVKITFATGNVYNVSLIDEETHF